MSIYTFAITFANSGISLAATRIVSEELDGNGGVRYKNSNEKMYNLQLMFWTTCLHFANHFCSILFKYTFA